MNRLILSPRMLVLFMLYYGQCSVFAQQATLEVYPEITQFITALKSLSLVEPAEARDQAVKQYWQTMVNARHIPYTYKDIAVFLYYGNVSSVQWQGDFSSWGNKKNYNTKGNRIEGTDLWYWFTSIPEDGRVDYKLVINEKEWILDPAHTSVQWSGVGGGSPNSSLSMPAYKPSKWTISAPNTPQGILSEPIIVTSTHLGYDVSYQLYTPATKPEGGFASVLYVTDGQEYAHDKLGRYTVAADNLIQQKLVTPFYMVLVSPINPKNPSENRRFNELINNEKYLQFFTDELMPLVEQGIPYRVMKKDRAIMGTSLGGLNATYFIAKRSDLFGKAAIHSPAYWIAKDAIFKEISLMRGFPDKVYMSVGTINDGEDLSDEMADVLKKMRVPLHYEKISQGHSWGNWSDLAGNTFLSLFGLH